jgi:hypothetical protein
MDTFEGINERADRRSESFVDDLSQSFVWILLAVLASLCVLLVFWRFYQLVSSMEKDFWCWCDGWYEQCTAKEIDDNNIGSIDFQLFKENIKSFGFVEAVEMENISQHQKKEVVSIFLYNNIERDLFLQHCRKLGVDYANEASLTLKEMSQSTPELWYMVILGWAHSTDNDVLNVHYNYVPMLYTENETFGRLLNVENDISRTNELNGIHVTEMQPEQLPIKKLNAFRLCILLDTFLHMRYQTFPECHDSNPISLSYSPRNRISDYNGAIQLNVSRGNKGIPSPIKMVKVEESFDSITTEIIETSFCEHSNQANLNIKYVTNIPPHVQKIIVDIATNGCIKFPEDDICCSYYIESKLKSSSVQLLSNQFKTNQPIICIRKIKNMKLFESKMDCFDVANQILYFTIFDRGCIVINDFTNQAKYLHKLLNKASREGLRKSMNFPFGGVTYVWKFLPAVSTNKSGQGDNLQQEQNEPTLFVSCN